jgi:predicted permease
MRNFVLDLILVLRRLRKSPVFSVVAILMLAVSIGATTVIFSVMEGILLRPLPFQEPSRLVIVADQLKKSHGIGRSVTAPDIPVYIRDTHAFSSLGGYQASSYELSGHEDPAQINAARLTSGVLPALGVAPILGRIFTPDEDKQHQPVAVLSYATWQSRFQANPQILGTKILLDRKPYVVVGVMPRNFEFPLLPGHLNRSELWVPMSFSNDELTRGADWSYQMVGRLKPGYTLQQAQQEANVVAQEIMRNYPAYMASVHINAVVRPLHEEIVSGARPLVRTLFFAVAVVMLIACANLAGLLLVRMIRRQREIAVCRALGAPASALMRQSLLESVTVSVLGGVAGLALAAVTLYVSRNLFPESLPRINEIRMNWIVMAFSLLLTIGTGLLCGLAPAFAAFRTNVNSSLKEGGRSGPENSGHARLRSILVVTEIAVALVLLTASGLLLRSFEKMRSVDLGFRSDHVTIGAYSLPQKQYSTQPAIDTFNTELLSRLKGIPGVQSVGLTNFLPATGGNMDEAFVAEGYTPSKGEGMNAASAAGIIGDYFKSMKIPLIRGRFFTEGDTANAQLVTIVSQKLAQHYWPNQNPIGKRLRIGIQETQTPWLTVVGEVGDVKLGSPDEPNERQFYFPVAQLEASIGSLATPSDLNGNGCFIVLRSNLPPEQIENSLRATVHTIDPQLPLTQLQTMEQAVSDTEAPRSFNTAIISGFAGIAVLLAILGIYSVVAFSVASRTQEIAIRIALGSQRAEVIKMILAYAAKLAIIGCVIGLTGATATSGLLHSFLFEVKPFDPMVFFLAVITILLLAIAASVLPALRAASIDPIQALRGE